MKMLLDTHTFIWFIGKHPNISMNARKLIQDPANQSILNMASVWEIAIKVSTGKLTLHEPFEMIFPKQIWDGGYTLLNIQISHTAIVATLPYHHRDPFDRILVAQAMAEQIPIISDDSALDAYPITPLW